MASDTGQHKQEREWLQRMSSQKADTIKLIICVGGSIFLFSYLLRTHGKKPKIQDQKVQNAPMVIKKDSLPFAKRSKEQVTDGQGVFPYGPDVLEKVKHKNSFLEPEAYFYLANDVMIKSQEQLRKEANRKVTWRDVFIEPKKYQGTTMAITGSLARIREAPLASNPCGLKSVFQGQIIDKDWRFWTFILIEGPDKSFQEGDLVRVYGQFFKIWEYETNLPNTRKLNAVIVGKRFVHVELNKDPIAGWYIVGLAAVTVVVLATAQVLAKKSDRQVDAVRKKKAQKKRPSGINDMAKALSARAVNEQEAALRANKEALRKKFLPGSEQTSEDETDEDEEHLNDEDESLDEEVQQLLAVQQEDQGDDSDSGLKDADEDEDVEDEEDDDKAEGSKSGFGEWPA